MKQVSFPKQLATTNLKGGALYYALFVLMVLGMICVLLLMYVQLLSREGTNFYQTGRLTDNVQSSLEMVCGSPIDYPPAGSIDVDILGNGDDSVTVDIEQWGLLKIMTAKAHWRKLSVHKTVLAGELEQKRWALWMPDMGSYLSLVGNSSITGNCCVSELGFRKGNVEGKYFTGPYMVKGSIEKSARKMIEPSAELLKHLSGLVDYQPTAFDTVVTIQPKNSSPLHFNHSFDGPLAIVKTKGNYQLGNAQIIGKVLLNNTDTMTIGASSRISNAIVTARVIIVEKGFSGQLQAVATERIEVGADCILTYPSFLIVNAELPEAQINVGEGAQINGGLLLYSSNAQPGKTVATIGKKATVIGKIYVNGQLSLNSNMAGGVYCTQFIHQTERAFYENFLFDRRIDNSKLPADYTSFCLTNELAKYRIVDIVN